MKTIDKIKKNLNEAKLTIPGSVNVVLYKQDFNPAGWQVLMNTLNAPTGKRANFADWDTVTFVATKITVEE